MMRRLFLLVGLLASAASCGGDPPALIVVTPHVDEADATIPDAGMLERELVVGAMGTIVRATAEVILHHERPDEVTVTLVSPAGTEVVLGGRIAEGGDDYRYAAPLLALQGEPAAGTWRLVIADRIAGGEEGTLFVWAVAFEALE